MSFLFLVSSGLADYPDPVMNLTCVNSTHVLQTASWAECNSTACTNYNFSQTMVCRWNCTENGCVTADNSWLPGIIIFMVGGVLITVGMEWNEGLEVLKGLRPLLIFSGLLFLTGSITIARRTVQISWADTGIVDMADRMIMMLTWIFMIAVTFYMIEFLVRVLIWFKKMGKGVWGKW